MKQATVIALALALAACGGKGNGATGKVSLSTNVAATAAASTAPGGNALAIGDHVTLDRARFLIRKVVLEAEGTEQDATASGPGETGGGATATVTGADHPAGDPGDPGDTGDTPDGSADGTPGDDAVVRAGPLVIDLSGSQLDGGVALLFDQSVPAGTYDDLKFQVHPLTPGETVTDADFQPLGHSIVLDLTVDGATFQFVTDLTAVSEVPGPLVVPDGGAINVTVTVDPGRWFTAPDGAFLDPRVDANRSQIEANIRGSIRGFEDDDHDGEPDHG